MGTSREQRIDSEQHHEAMIRTTVSDKAKEWFRRPAYSIKRGGTSEQADTK